MNKTRNSIKDAAAASLYGSRAANGVIVITTKSGSAGKTHVDFRSDWGFSNMAINYRPTLSGNDRNTIALEWNIWDALKLREKVAYDYINSVENVLWDKYSSNGKKSQGVLQRINNEFYTLNTQTQLSYVKTFGLNNIDALLGFETEAWHQNQQYTHGDTYPGDLYEFANAGNTSAESYELSF